MRLYLDAGLVAVVALLAVIVLGDSMMQWYGYVVLKRPFTSSEVVVMAGGGSPGRLQTTIRHDEESSGCSCPAGGAVKGAGVARCPSCSQNAHDGMCSSDARSKGQPRPLPLEKS